MNCLVRVDLQFISTCLKLSGANYYIITQKLLKYSTIETFIEELESNLHKTSPSLLIRDVSHLREAFAWTRWFMAEW